MVIARALEENEEGRGQDLPSIRFAAQLRLFCPLNLT
jgi:hypothetical protein